MPDLEFENAFRAQYGIKEHVDLTGFRKAMTQPVNEVFRAVSHIEGLSARISSVVRQGEDTAHGHGFGIDFKLSDMSHGPALEKELGDLLSPLGYYVLWHADRVEGEDHATEKHLHIQRRTPLYRETLAVERKQAQTPQVLASVDAGPQEQPEGVAQAPSPFPTSPDGAPAVVAAPTPPKEVKRVARRPRGRVARKGGFGSDVRFGATGITAPGAKILGPEVRGTQSMIDKALREAGVKGK